MSQESKKAGSEEQGQALKNGDERGRLKEILTYLENTDLEYVFLEKGGKKLSFRRAAEACGEIKKTPVSEPDRAGAQNPEPPRTFSIRSPIVGRFYSSMGPDRPPLVVEGDRVTAGQKVSIVEAMNIKKEVFSAVTGKIARIFVRNGDPVEYGQELFQIEPDQTEEGASPVSEKNV